MVRSINPTSACATCDTPDPCLYEITLDFGKQKQTWPIVPNLAMNLLDEGQGASGTINAIPKCLEAASHTATLNNGHRSQPIAFNQPVAVTLSANDAAAAVVGGMPSIVSYLANIANPADLYADAQRYQLVVNGCEGPQTYATLNVYPSVEFMYSLAFSYDFLREERHAKDRQDEWSKAPERMKKVQPANGKRLRGDWKLHTDTFNLTKTTALTYQYQLKIQDMDYSAKFAEKNRRKSTSNTLDTLSQVDKLLDKIKKYLLPAPDEKKSDGSKKTTASSEQAAQSSSKKKPQTQQYQITELTLSPINVGIAYAYSRTEVEEIEHGSHFFGLHAEPFLAVTFKLDLLQLAAAYCKVGNVASKCREALKRKNANDKNYLEVECYLALSLSLSFHLGAVYQQPQWTFDFGKGNGMKFSIEGIVNGAFRTRVLVMEVALNASASVKTAGSVESDPHDKGIDLVAYHDGIVAEVEFSADAKRENGRTKNSTEGSSMFKVKKQWKVAAPIKMKESPVRVNLLGQAREIAQPEVLTSSEWSQNNLEEISGPGRWVTTDNDYHGLSNIGVMVINRLTSMGDEGRLFGSEGKDYMNTVRDKVQTWQPLPAEANADQIESSAIHTYGSVRKIKQRFLEGDDNWQIDGKSWHWQPVVADEIYEKKG